MALIQSLDFNNETPNKAKSLKYGKDWPVVYIINNVSEAYVGETVNATMRISQHLKNPERRLLKKISFVSDNNFNKSVILDLESYLIRYMSADGKYRLQNSNMGMQRHNYYNRESYVERFNDVWQQLKEQGLVTNSVHTIENTDVFKYSPYKELNVDQYIIIEKIIEDLITYQNTGEGKTTIVQGGPGTGKTVLAVYIMKLMSEYSQDTNKSIDIDPSFGGINENLKKLIPMKIGLVVPMQSLRTTIKKVFKNIKDLNVNMVISPVEVPKENYDLLIIDEAHRLRQRKALAQYPVFDRNNEKLGFDNNGTELDWIIKCSKNQIFFYDSMQSVKPSDIDKEYFNDLLKNKSVTNFNLESQFRCQGGNDYIDYVKEIFSCNPPTECKTFGDYDFKLFDSVEKMVQTIKGKNDEFGLCRVVAGYAWKWNTKKNKGANAFDIDIKGYKYKWNSVNKDWVNSPNAINEIGCIHTIQGYDLNYAGVILGKEIRYNEREKKIYVDKSNYHDLQGKTSLKNEGQLYEYIINIYTTMLMRGIKGTYLYACDEELQKYLSKYIKN